MADFLPHEITVSNSDGALIRTDLSIYLSLAAFLQQPPRFSHVITRFTFTLLRQITTPKKNHLHTLWTNYLLASLSAQTDGHQDDTVVLPFCACPVTEMQRVKSYIRSESELVVKTYRVGDLSSMASRCGLFLSLYTSHTGRARRTVDDDGAVRVTLPLRFDGRIESNSTLRQALTAFADALVHLPFLLLSRTLVCVNMDT